MRLPRDPWKWISSIAFVLTGVGVALPGAILPALLHQWQFSDRQGGLLLMTAWGTSTAASFLVRRNPRLLTPIGLAMTSCAQLVLAATGTALRLPLFALYGAGLGIAMTSINICRVGEVPAADRNREMNRLNMLWAIGACLTPGLTIRLLQFSLSTTFTTIGLLFGSLSLAAFWYLHNAPTNHSESEHPPRTIASPTPLAFCLFAALAVGIESSIGGWLTTYMQRSGHGSVLAMSTNSFFWIGLLTSRAVWSLPWNRFRTESFLGMQLLLTFVAVVLLLRTEQPSAMLIAAVLAGLGIGPLYPAILAIVLPRFHSNIIFVGAGIGAASLPWLVGYISTVSHSLQRGLWALSAAVVALVATAFASRTTLRKLGLNTPEDKYSHTL